jgi:hypothetical protein
VEIEVPDGIIAHLTRECGGNVHDSEVVEVTSGSLEKETKGAHSHSAKNVVYLETDSCFYAAHRNFTKDIPHTRNNWVCYDFRERRIVPTHYAIRTSYYGSHLKSWVVETSVDGEKW